GEVHALCGENGAGKSTLMKLIAGNIKPDKGNIYWEGVPVIFNSAADSIKKGVGIVYQERSLFMQLSVAENIFPVKQPCNHWGLIDFAKLIRQTKELLDQLKLNDISPNAIVGSLPTAHQQMVEIAKALAVMPKLLILDEPTASITQKETWLLFDIIRELTAKGVAVIYISHRMQEIPAIADKISVLKDGIFQGTIPANTSIDEIIKMMVGRNIPHHKFKNSTRTDVALEVGHFTGRAFQNISFNLFAGEILGLAGLIGAGRSQLGKAIFGASLIKKGNVNIYGKLVRIHSPNEAVANGIAYLPEDRKLFGVFSHLSIDENIISASLNKYAVKGLLNYRKIRKFAEQFRKLLHIKSVSINENIESLSGGNQQKVLLARWFSVDPLIIIADEPTHGIDIGSKSEMYTFFRKFVEDGKSILLISSELPELLLLCDRIAVMNKGEIKAVLNRKEATEELLMHYASD
ncbi:MAG TPA: sugar ABC transporter ATP-binding protein, partial [Puia sp.]